VVLTDDVIDELPDTDPESLELDETLADDDSVIIGVCEVEAVPDTDLDERPLPVEERVTEEERDSLGETVFIPDTETLTVADLVAVIDLDVVPLTEEVLVVVIVLDPVLEPLIVLLNVALLDELAVYEESVVLVVLAEAEADRPCGFVATADSVDDGDDPDFLLANAVAEVDIVLIADLDGLTEDVELIVCFKDTEEDTLEVVDLELNTLVLTVAELVELFVDCTEKVVVCVDVIEPVDVFDVELVCVSNPPIEQPNTF
jgi:hypothetical protein